MQHALVFCAQGSLPNLPDLAGLLSGRRPPQFLLFGTEEPTRQLRARFEVRGLPHCACSHLPYMRWPSRATGCVVAAHRLDPPFAVSLSEQSCTPDPSSHVGFHHACWCMVPHPQTCACTSCGLSVDPHRHRHGFASCRWRRPHAHVRAMPMLHAPRRISMARTPSWRRAPALRCCPNCAPAPSLSQVSQARACSRPP